MLQVDVRDRERGERGACLKIVAGRFRVAVGKINHGSCGYVTIDVYTQGMMNSVFVRSPGMLDNR